MGEVIWLCEGSWIHLWLTLFNPSNLLICIILSTLQCLIKDLLILHLLSSQISYHIVSWRRSTIIRIVLISHSWNDLNCLHCLCLPLLPLWCHITSERWMDLSLLNLHKRGEFCRLDAWMLVNDRVALVCFICTRWVPSLLLLLHTHINSINWLEHLVLDLYHFLKPMLGSLLIETLCCFILGMTSTTEISGFTYGIKLMLKLSTLIHIFRCVNRPELLLCGALWGLVICRYIGHPWIRAIEWIWVMSVVCGHF